MLGNGNIIWKPPSSNNLIFILSPQAKLFQIVYYQNVKTTERQIYLMILPLVLRTLACEWGCKIALH